MLYYQYVLIPSDHTSNSGFSWEESEEPRLIAEEGWEDDTRPGTTEEPADSGTAGPEAILAEPTREVLPSALNSYQASAGQDTNRVHSSPGETSSLQEQ